MAEKCLAQPAVPGQIQLAFVVSERVLGQGGGGCVCKQGHVLLMLHSLTKHGHGDCVFQHSPVTQTHTIRSVLLTPLAVCLPSRHPLAVSVSPNMVSQP